MSVGLRIDSQRSLRAFLSHVRIQREKGGVGSLEVQDSQEAACNALARRRSGGGGDWLLINKPRQAMISTLCVGWLLRDVMLTPGYNGLILTNKDETSAELWSRLRLMYEGLPVGLKVRARTEAAKEMQFEVAAGGGRIKTLTALGKDPGLGMSIDRLLASEFGMWSRPEVIEKVLPALVKRPHARVVIESTPGVHGGQYHSMWMRALSGQGWFSPVFLRWFDFEGYRKDAVGFVPGVEELRYMERYGCESLEHMAFRRAMIEGVYDGRASTFDHYYPPDEYGGWESGEVQALEVVSEVLQGMHREGRPDTVHGGGWETPRVGGEYMVVVDPNGYGTKGNPSAYTVFDIRRGVEVAAWSDRIDPQVLGGTILPMVGKHWNQAQVVVEANAAACITALVGSGYRRVWNGKEGSPGYTRTGQNKERSLSELVRRLREGTIHLRSKAGIGQLLAYDGKSTKRVEGDASRSGVIPHWDRVVTYCIYADVTSAIKVEPMTVKPRVPGELTEGGLARWTTSLNQAERRRAAGVHVRQHASVKGA